mmetsp:Transcript_23356/g.35517  ORF Transcript_23356/g.35517 Transcript_23356/m.35517 type:complete len:253 (-) Transcript_23356:56-814(-)
MSSKDDPSDSSVKDAIISSVGSMDVKHMRPNKLRKIMCKQTNCSWTQYQTVLDELISDGAVKTKHVEGEAIDVILSNSDGKKAAVKSKMTEEMTIPIEVILHLTRKGQRKKKNIELNSKTKITFDEPTSRIVKTKDITGVKKGTLTITKFWEPDADADADAHTEGEEKEEAKKVAKKQFKAAKFFIKSMVKSFKENPDHFAQKKAGGTFAEQAEAKKVREELTKRRRNTHADDEAAGTAGGEKKKKKERKYY